MTDRKLPVPDFGEEVSRKRREVRERASRMQRELGAERFLEWFDQLYDEAEGDPARVPWADMEPHPALVEWLADNGPHRGRALEVGCGLGDNAKALADAGYDVTAFDISPRAVDWARRRFADSGIAFHVCNLLDAPDEWAGAFDFLHETYTLQSLPVSLRGRCFAPLADFLKPGGRLLAICRARPDDAAPEGPPWPLSEKELEGFTSAGLKRLFLQRIILEGGRAIPHFISLWEKPAG